MQGRPSAARFFCTERNTCHCEPAVNRRCHCEPVRTLVWQSVSPWLPLWGSCHEVTERANTPSLPLAGHLSHGERQGPHPSRLRRATFPMGEGFSPGLVHRYKNRIQKLCVLHRKSCVLGGNHPILHFDEKRIAIAAPFVYNVCIAVPGTQAKSYGSTVFPKGVFDHYVYC